MPRTPVGHLSADCLDLILAETETALRDGSATPVTAQSGRMRYLPIRVDLHSPDAPVDYTLSGYISLRPRREPAAPTAGVPQADPVLAALLAQLRAAAAPPAAPAAVPTAPAVAAPAAPPVRGRR